MVTVSFRVRVTLTVKIRVNLADLPLSLPDRGKRSLTCLSLQIFLLTLMEVTSGHNTVTTVQIKCSHQQLS